MKRIANKVAVQTVTNTIRGNQRIKVLNRKSYWDKNPKVEFDGECCELFSYEYARIRASQVYGIEIVDGVLVITIENEYEEF